MTMLGETTIYHHLSGSMARSCCGTRQKLKWGGCVPQRKTNWPQCTPMGYRWIQQTTKERNGGDAHELQLWQGQVISGLCIHVCTWVHMHVHAQLYIGSSYVWHRWKYDIYIYILGASCMNLGPQVSCYALYIWIPFIAVWGRPDSLLSWRLSSRRSPALRLPSMKRGWVRRKWKKIMVGACAVLKIYVCCIALIEGSSLSYTAKLAKAQAFLPSTVDTHLYSLLRAKIAGAKKDCMQKEATHVRRS